MVSGSCFAPPVPVRPRPRIQPVFLPFTGCPERCVFCAQTLQTGRSPEPPARTLAGLESSLSGALARGEPARELAFYGGTFTAMPPEAQAAYLMLARRFKEAGLVTAVRCSTRPDAVDAARLVALRDLGLDMVELGIQSFDDAVLAASRPGYTGQAALAACRAVTESGLALGAQLMPGLPGMEASSFRRDMECILSARPRTLRLYPCLVIEGTPLAGLWREEKYAPWELEGTIELLAEALLSAERNGIAVIRMGLAPEPTLDPAILAGPHHPSLGSRVRGRALYLLVKEQSGRLGAPPAVLLLPRRLRGEFAGHAGELLPLYAALGLGRGNIRWHDEAWCELRA